MKTPKTVQVKLLVPYAIITVVAFGFVGLMAGWNLRDAANDQAKADAKEMVTSLSKPQEQK